MASKNSERQQLRVDNNIDRLTVGNEDALESGRGTIVLSIPRSILSVTN